MIAGSLPESGERFQGLLPPIVAQPTFAIRKRPKSVFTLDDYVARDAERHGRGPTPTGHRRSKEYSRRRRHR
jgi:Flp pilus assembly CpaF family ATPase